MCLCKNSDFQPLLECKLQGSWRQRLNAVALALMHNQPTVSSVKILSDNIWKKRRLDFENQELWVCGKNWSEDFAASPRMLTYADVRWRRTEAKSLQRVPAHFHIYTTTHFQIFKGSSYDIKSLNQQALRYLRWTPKFLVVASTITSKNSTHSTKCTWTNSLEKNSMQEALSPSLGSFKAHLRLT